MDRDCGKRPLLGTVLLDQGALKDGDLDRALRAQAESGERLGEILIELDLLSRPALDRAIAGQSGVELEHERGYGTGLRAEIERRHRGRRGLGPGERETDRRASPGGSRSAAEGAGQPAADIPNSLEGALGGISERIAELRRELERLSGRAEPAAGQALS